MVCDRCEESREKGYSFCPGCGNPLNEGCLYCAQYERDGYEYCGKCGRHLGEHRQPASGDTDVRSPNPLKMGTLFSTVFIVLALVAELGAMFYFFGEGLDWIGENGSTFFLLLPGIVKICTFTGASAQVYFVLIAAAIIASFIVLMYQSLPAMKPRSDGDASKVERTPLYGIALLFGSVIIIELVINLIMAAIGSPLEIPEWIDEMTMGESIFEYAEAAVIEEIASRIVIIGVPMALLALCYGRRDFLKNLLGGFGMSRVALILLIASSIVFAVAHMGSWGIAKVFPTIVGGLAIGWLYIEYGVHASIMYHFLTDYLGVLVMVNDVLAASLLLIILVAGLVCLIELGKKTVDGVRRIKDLPICGFETGSEEKED